MKGNRTGGFATRPNRRSIRLKDYDYTQGGAYFITICTQDRACLFGEIMDGEMQLNDAGRMVWAEWNALPQRFPAVEMNAFIVMPNHVHGIIVIIGVKNVNGATVGAGLVPAHDVPAHGDRATTRVAPTMPDRAALPSSDGATRNGATTRVTPTVGDIVGAFKSITTVIYTRVVKQSDWPPFRGLLWQRNYYEHIIRNDESLNRIREYIANNPLQWATDRENPDIVIPMGNQRGCPYKGRTVAYLTESDIEQAVLAWLENTGWRVAHGRRHGYRHLAINHFWRTPEELDDLHHRLLDVDADTDICCFLLTLPLDEHLRRIQQRQSARACDEQEFERRTVEKERQVLIKRGDGSLGKPFDVSTAPVDLVETLLLRLEQR